jgi:ADP-ribose pyrophosphatase YjhB (NUDIX family)
METLLQPECHECVKGCCKYYVANYERKSMEYKSRKERPKKAGIFIVSEDTQKILLVQSKGQYWGPPKGSLNENETLEEGAVREVMEETGLVFDRDSIGEIRGIKGRAFYFFQTIPEVELRVQLHVENNDANGIGWFSLDCLEALISRGVLRINQHCRYLIRKLLDVNIAENYKHRFFGKNNNTQDTEL